MPVDAKQVNETVNNLMKMIDTQKSSGNPAPAMPNIPGMPAIPSADGADVSGMNLSSMLSGFDTTTIIIYIVTGLIGTVYLFYGKSTQSIPFTLAGIALCFYPYFFSNVIVLVVLGLVFVITPIFIGGD